MLYVHPFAEEMNRSRRMAALQARELAALGYGVLQIDLLGCGDSSGDFGDARWDLWKQDLASAAAWLGQRLEQPVTLWGLRLGALLALDYARSATHPVAGMLLWQPVLSGPAFLTQFLRLRVASAMLNNTSERGGTSALRAASQAGDVLEIGGYALAPAMAAAIDALESVEAMPPAAPVHWVEAVGSADSPLSPGARARGQGMAHAGRRRWTCTWCPARPSGARRKSRCRPTGSPPPRPFSWKTSMGFEERAVSFACQGDALYGVLSLPQGACTRGVLIVVGGPQYRAGSHRQFTLLARSLAAQGLRRCASITAAWATARERRAASIRSTRTCAPRSTIYWRPCPACARSCCGACATRPRRH